MDGFGIIQFAEERVVWIGQLAWLSGVWLAPSMKLTVYLSIS